MIEQTGYLLTAYGLAVKHGFQGTEEEWLESITAYGFAVKNGYSGSFADWIAKLNDPVPRFTVGSTKTIAAGFNARVYITGTVENPVLHFEIPRGAGQEDAFMRTGGELLGPLSMGGFALTNIPDPQGDGDAVNKEYVDAAIDQLSDVIRGVGDTAQSALNVAAAAVPASGGTVSGKLAVNGGLSVPAPVNGADAASKDYVDARHFVVTISLPASGWSNAAPFKQTLPISGILSTDRPHFGVIFTSNWAAEKEAFAVIDDLDTNSGRVTFTCYEVKPADDLTIQLEVNR